jgi:hypothetical protein
VLAHEPQGPQEPQAFKDLSGNAENCVPQPMPSPFRLGFFLNYPPAAAALAEAEILRTREIQAGYAQRSAGCLLVSSPSANGCVLCGRLRLWEASVDELLVLHRAACCFARQDRLCRP